MIKKFGFTLAEILVTLTIIGIVAALIVPAISNLRPDKNKTAYLQVYDTISQTVKSLAANSRLYPVCNNPNVEDNVNCSQYPLLNTSRPLDNQYNNAIYQGDRKLCSLMALSLGVAEDDIDCSNTTYAFNAADYTDGFANESFVTKNGMRWRIVPQIATYTNNFEARFQNDIYVDIDPSNNDIDGEDRSCIFDEENCTQPDIFKFMVGADGKVVPADPMGRLYISSRKSLVRKNLEEDAFDEDNVITASLAARDKVFLYSKCNGEQGTPCNADETMEITADGITCTANDDGDGGEGGEEDIACLRNLRNNAFEYAREVAWYGTPVCGRKVNSVYTSMKDSVFTARFGTSVASPVTITVKTFKVDSGRYYTWSEVSCTVTPGSNTCSINSALPNKEMGAPSISLKYDSKYFYTAGADESTLYVYFRTLP